MRGKKFIVFIFKKHFFLVLNCLEDVVFIAYYCRLVVLNTGNTSQIFAWAPSHLIVLMWASDIAVSLSTNHPPCPPPPHFSNVQTGLRTTRLMVVFPVIKEITNLD